jgi:hypothetical protein
MRDGLIIPTYLKKIQPNIIEVKATKRYYLSLAKETDFDN